MSDNLTAGVFTHNPLYREVKSRIIQNLANGEWKPGERIPSEAKLASHFNVSIGTIRKAVDDLVVDNILVRQQGRGTYVTTHNRDRNVFQFFHFVREDGVVEYPQTVLKGFEQVRADAEIAERLDIKRNARMYRILMDQSLGGDVVLVNDVRLPASLFPGMPEPTWIGKETFYGHYHGQYGINVIRTEENVRALAAGEEVAAKMNIAVGTPILEIVRVAYTFNDQPVEYRETLVNTAHYRYRNNVAKK